MTVFALFTIGHNYCSTALDESAKQSEKKIGSLCY